MKIELTVAELEALINADRVAYLERENSSLRDENWNLESRAKDLKLKVRDLEGKLASEKRSLYRENTSPLAQLIKAAMEYNSAVNSITAKNFRNKLEDLFPGEKILQIKILREVAGIGLKEAKDFLEGDTWVLFPH